VTAIKVIGVVGQNGSGKDEVLKYLQLKHDVPFLATGDIVREIAAAEGVEPTRSNLGAISDRYFKEHGKGHFIKMAVKRIIQNGWKTAGVSGIRSPEDVAILHNILGPDFVLIQVTVADPEIRYSRMAKRGEGRDRATTDEFRRQDEAEEKLFRVTKAMRLANFGLSNNGSLADLHKQIDALVTAKGLLD